MEPTRKMEGRTPEKHLEKNNIKCGKEKGWRWNDVIRMANNRV
jgi:hypothetical protein